MTAGQIIAEAYEKTLTLSCYGHAEGTVGWWRGQSYARLWNFRTGRTEWRPFTSSQPQRPAPDSSFGWSWGELVKRLAR